MTENVLTKENVPHTVSGPEIVVHGNESDRFADLLNVETRRTMNKGVLNPPEPDSLGMLRKIVESLLDPPRNGRSCASPFRPRRSEPKRISPITKPRCARSSPRWATR